MKRRTKNNLIYLTGILLNLIPIIFWGNLFNLCCLITLFCFWQRTIFNIKRYYFYIHEGDTLSNLSDFNLIYSIRCKRIDKNRIYCGITSEEIDLYPDQLNFFIRISSKKVNKCLSLREFRPIFLKNIKRKYIFNRILFPDEIVTDINQSLTTIIYGNGNKLNYEKDKIYYNININRIWGIDDRLYKDNKLFDEIYKYLESDEFRKEFDITRERWIRCKKV
jgi:hypothetical protein